MYADVLIAENGEIEVSRDNPLFEEHFPEFAVLPGAFSIVCCINVITESLNKQNGKKYQLYRIKKASFLKPIKPGMKFTLKLLKIIDSDKTKQIAFSLDDEVNHSYLRGLLLLGEQE